MSRPIVELSNIRHEFGSVVAISDISLNIMEGSFTVLLGPSGSGKTTLLSILGGFQIPTSGKVVIAGEDMTEVPASRRPTSTVFQDYALFPHMSVGANVGFGLKMRGVGKRERNERARAILDVVGLADTFNRKPNELSGGQRQRVALVRSLLMQPKVILLDEPLGALDLKLRRQLQEELKSIQKKVGTTFVHVTHDQEEAMAVGDTIVVLNQGHIEDMGSPEQVYLRPKTVFTASFMGENNLLKGTVKSVADGIGTIDTPLGAVTAKCRQRAGTPVQVALRPEHIVVNRAGAEGDGVTATVVEMGFFGTHHQCICVPEGASEPQIRVRMAQDAAVQPGTRIKISAAPKMPVVFPIE